MNSIDMTISPPQERKDQIVKQCQDLLRMSPGSIQELTQFVERLASTATGALLAPLQYRAMQCEQLLELSVAGNYSLQIKLSDKTRAHNPLLAQINKEIWEYLLEKGIIIIAEYLPGSLNKEVNMLSQTVKDSHEWNLNPMEIKIWWSSGIDPFAFRVSYQVPTHVLWKRDPYSIGMDVFQMCWTHKKRMCFPPFSLKGRVLHKVLINQATLILITPAYQTQFWYPQLLRFSIRNPLISSKITDLLQGPNKEHDLLTTKGNLQLLAWIVSGKDYLQKEYQRNLPLLSQTPEKQAQSLITSCPCVNDIADVLGVKLIPLNVLRLTFYIF